MNTTLPRGAEFRTVSEAAKPASTTGAPSSRMIERLTGHSTFTVHFPTP